MRFTTSIALVTVIAAAGLMAAGCDAGSAKDKAKGVVVSGQELTGTTKDPKVKQLTMAADAFKKKAGDLNACRNLAQTWIAYASPDAPKKEGDLPKIPKDRDESLKQARKVLEKCAAIKKDDPQVTQTLASVYMALNEQDKAAPLLEGIAKERKTDANSYYAWGLAESGAANTKGVITAWKLFLQYADPKDPRIKQTKDSIKALEAEAARPAPKAAPAAADKSEKSSK